MIRKPFDLFALEEDDRWLRKYAPGTLRTKRVDQFVKMAVNCRRAGSTADETARPDRLGDRRRVGPRAGRRRGRVAGGGEPTLRRGALGPGVVIRAGAVPARRAAGVIAEHEEALATAGAIADAATADVVDPAALEAFEGAVQASDQVKAEASDALAAAEDLPDESAPPPFWPWDLLASQDEFVHHTRGNADTATGLRELRHGLRPGGGGGCRGAGPLRVHASSVRPAPGGEPLGADRRRGRVPVGDGCGRGSPGRDARVIRCPGRLCRRRDAPAGIEPGRDRGGGRAAARPTPRGRGLRQLARRRHPSSTSTGPRS